MTTCTQSGCTSPAAYLLVWPGWPESPVCELHAMKARAAAKQWDLPVLDPKGDPTGRRIMGIDTIESLLKMRTPLLVGVSGETISSTPPDALRAGSFVMLTPIERKTPDLVREAGLVAGVHVGKK